MKKRGVSPVIATILLIALVTAAAAIVFLVVIPMLNPAPKAIVQEVVAIDAGGGNYSVTITVQAEGQDIVFNGTLVSAPTVTYIGVTSTLPLSIPNGETKQIIILGSFQLGVAYTLTMTFTAGESTATGIAEFTPS
ncbi:MAG: archaellin/type IV pilin N-terminal domain-containing protein [Candidatus Heimdallarchaeaceae archaeon]|jgi:flagellin-like protein